MHIWQIYHTITHFRVSDPIVYGIISEKAREKPKNEDAEFRLKAIETGQEYEYAEGQLRRMSMPGSTIPASVHATPSPQRQSQRQPQGKQQSHNRGINKKDNTTTQVRTDTETILFKNCSNWGYEHQWM